jgi:26S proteasome regulatory subunit N12
MYTLLGLNLLGLLASNEIARFHSELERIETDQMMGNVLIQYPMQLEQWMMEGSYSKLWQAVAHPPVSNYVHFSEKLLGTIR